jgi:hypothetical protein
MYGPRGELDKNTLGADDNVPRRENIAVGTHDKPAPGGGPAVSLDYVNKNDRRRNPCHKIGVALRMRHRSAQSYRKHQA